MFLHKTDGSQLPKRNNLYTKAFLRQVIVVIFA